MISAQSRAGHPSATSLNDAIAQILDAAATVSPAASWARAKRGLAADLAAFLAALPGGPADPASQADLQVKHWEALLGDAVGAADSAAAPAAAHRSLGLPSGYCTAAAGWLVARLLRGRPAGFGRRAHAAADAALVARLFADLVRINAGREAAGTSAEEVSRERNLRSLRDLARTVADVNDAAFELAYLTRNTRNMSTGAETIASAAAELVASVEEIARNSGSAAEDAQETNRNVSTGRAAVDKVGDAIGNIAKAVDETSRSVDELAQASKQIEQILTVIESIAGQTNLLALNATIEAARAGEAGRGFAVVASEVKSLANQTSKSTEDITRRVVSLREGMNQILTTMQRSNAAVRDGQAAIAEAAQTMGMVAAQVDNVTGKMQDISSILHQQKDASAEIADSIQKVAGIANGNQDLVRTMIANLGDNNARFGSYAKEWFDAGSHRSLVEMAKIDHVMFKKRVVDAVMGQASWHAAEVPDHHHCRLGKWYDSVDLPELKALPAFAELVEPHQQVHAAGKRALAAHEAGDLDAALSALTEMNAASAAVLAVLNRMSEALAEPAA